MCTSLDIEHALGVDTCKYLSTHHRPRVTTDKPCIFWFSRLKLIQECCRESCVCTEYFAPSTLRGTKRLLHARVLFSSALCNPWPTHFPTVCIVVRVFPRPCPLFLSLCDIQYRPNRPRASVPRRRYFTESQIRQARANFAWEGEGEGERLPLPKCDSARYPRCVCAQLQSDILILLGLFNEPVHYPLNYYC